MNSADTHRWQSTRRTLLISAAVFVTALLVANAHLVYVSFTSQPDCVPHKTDTGEASFRAAKSAC